MNVHREQLEWPQAPAEPPVSPAEALSAVTAAAASGGNGAARPRVKLPRIRLHGVAIHAITEKQTIDFILDSLDNGRGGVVVTPNLDHLRRSRRDLAFGALLAEANLVVADGMPLVWASRLQGTPLPQRVAGSDLISTLSAGAAVRGKSIFLLGGQAGTAVTAARVLKDRHPSLNIAGTHYPPPGFESVPDEIALIIEKLQKSRPDVVYVALGSPKQERLIEQLRSTLPQAWWLGVGVSFSFLTGDVRRAPMWMRRRGLEWVHRLSQEPRRLFKRYLLVGLPFAGQLLASAAAQRLTSRFTGVQEPPEETAHYAPTTRAPLAPPKAAAPAPIVQFSAANGNGLSRLRGLVLLAGSVRPTPLRTGIGRSVLDLPIDPGRTVFSHWLSEATEVARSLGMEKLPVRVLLPHGSPEPRLIPPHLAASYAIERDLSEYRGTGGILANLAGDYEDDDLILVANAAQIFVSSLPQVARDLGQTGGVVSLVSHQDGTPSGLMLLSGKALRLIPRQGFVDMKEQALPAIAAVNEVRVLHTRRPTGLPVRTLSDYVSALRQVHLRQATRPALEEETLWPRMDGMDVDEMTAEDWRPSFNIAESGAQVAATARVHDSVVLAGGVVEAGAVVVRCIVCDGGIVRRDRRSVDEIVGKAPSQNGHNGHRGINGHSANGNGANGNGGAKVKQ
ncbi:MAG TPA: WecB/TagA/CpsF family glycosyltransferase [Tepidisphaeraceae bacterium]|nr:WecB/TagA/CpsF family glycosyltransferase [Tepidisphaeraceae bacterium]